MKTRRRRSLKRKRRTKVPSLTRPTTTTKTKTARAKCPGRFITGWCMQARLLFAGIVLALLFASGGPAQAQVARLTNDAIPSAYDLTLAPDVVTGTISGGETIDIVTNRASSAIIMNALNVTVSQASIDGVAATTEMSPKS